MISTTKDNERQNDDERYDEHDGPADGRDDDVLVVFSLVVLVVLILLAVGLFQQVRRGGARPAPPRSDGA